jgi:hypothetical protein
MRNISLEEKTEITFNSKQIIALAIGILSITLMAFLMGFFMGKRSENRNKKLGTQNKANDLLSRLDKLEEESKNFTAKKALTNIRKREYTLNTNIENHNKIIQRVKPIIKNSKNHVLAVARKTKRSFKGKIRKVKSFAKKGKSVKRRNKKRKTIKGQYSKLKRRNSNNFRKNINKTITRK